MFSLLRKKWLLDKNDKINGFHLIKAQEPIWVVPAFKRKIEGKHKFLKKGEPALSQLLIILNSRLVF
jgi:hypothetical protein